MSIEQQQQRDRDFQNRFGYHPPKDDDVATMHAKIRESCQWLATIIDTYLPDGREKSLALTKVEEVMFWSNAGIARVVNYDGDRRPGRFA